MLLPKKLSFVWNCHSRKIMLFVEPACVIKKMFLLKTIGFLDFLCQVLQNIFLKQEKERTKIWSFMLFEFAELNCQIYYFLLFWLLTCVLYCRCFALTQIFSSTCWPLSAASLTVYLCTCYLTFSHCNNQIEI